MKSIVVISALAFAGAACTERVVVERPRVVVERPRVVVERPRAEPVGLEAWEHNHPEASRELGEWVKAHPEAAALFFKWDGHHPERAHEFVTWGITHPGDSIDVFVLSHPGWEHFDRIMESHRPAAEAFLAWTRRHPEAAEALMSHPRGLEWAGHHLYSTYWHMEAGG